MSRPVGYFQWRTDRRGVPQPRKILAVHRDNRRNSPNHAEQAEYHEGLLAEHPLDEANWQLPLDDLVAKFTAT